MTTIYLNDKLYFLRESLQQVALHLIMADWSFRALWGILFNSYNTDWTDPEFVRIAIRFRSDCTWHISRLGHEEGLEWPMSSVIPALENLVSKVDNCLLAVVNLKSR